MSVAKPRKMDARIQKVVDEAFHPQEAAGAGKVVSLSEAIRQHVRPGMNISFLTTHYRPVAALNEIIRQFWGTKPEFTLIGRTIRDETINLMHAGLIKKVIVGWSGYLYPTPAPNPIAQRLYQDRKVAIQNWSFLTLVQRLMAGALGVPFATTKSIQGSSMAEDNKDDFVVIDNPFEVGTKVGLLKALNPDLCIVHGWAADKEGNTIIRPPFFEDIWAAMASRNGVIVTVEKIVSSEFIRDHASQVRLPNYVVKSVSEVPLGAHPAGMTNHGLPEFEAYGEDYDYLNQFQETCNAGADALNQWISDWILATGDHDGYLRKLGHERVLSLKGKMARDSWRHKLRSIEEGEVLKPGYSAAEMMVCVGARKVRERMVARDLKTLLAGAGITYLVASVAHHLLKTCGHPVDLLTEIGHYGYQPVAMEPTVFSLDIIPGCKMHAGAFEALGVWVSGANNRCMGLMGTGQIDRFGNLNSTKVPERNIYITGSGGANDVASGARESVIVVQQSSRRLVDKVPFVTAPGATIRTLVTDLGTFEKPDGADELVLTGYFEKAEFAGVDAHLANIRKHCGWELKVSTNLEKVAPPTFEELTLIRLLDPHQQFLKS
jgi:acyl CoA:acetate/3-ketoacid CoA transferase alpha subunit